MRANVYHGSTTRVIGFIRGGTEKFLRAHPLAIYIIMCVYVCVSVLRVKELAASTYLRPAEYCIHVCVCVYGNFMRGSATVYEAIVPRNLFVCNKQICRGVRDIDDFTRARAWGCLMYT